MSVQVVSVVGSTASQQEDTHSHQVAAATLGAIAPAWVRSGKPISQLVAAVVALLPAMLPHRRLPLLDALLAVLPQVSLFCCCLCAWLCCRSVPVTVSRCDVQLLSICISCNLHLVQTGIKRQDHFL